VFDIVPGYRNRRSPHELSAFFVLMKTAGGMLRLDRSSIADEIDALKTPWEHMPFYLVTQTLLVEAENDEDAAEKAATRIRSGEKVTVSVKADETTIAHITVAATVDARRPVSPPIAEATGQSLVADREAVVARPTDRKLILKRMVANALSLVRP
jgi:hypothetical protein